MQTRLLAVLCAGLPMAVPASSVTGTLDDRAATRLDAAAEDSRCPDLPAAQASKTVLVPIGTYSPFFKADAQAAAKAADRPPPRVSVAAFRLDAAAVTRGEFLRFVCSHPEWRKSNVKALFAEESYLAGWPSDLDPGHHSLGQPGLGQSALDQPVTHVSWFAARAFCAARNARLPTLAEWERAAGSGDVRTEAQSTQSSNQANNPFRFAMGHPAADLQHSGLAFPGIWEWTADFNSVAAGNSGRGRSNLFCGDGFRSNDARDYGAFLRYSFRSSLRGNYTLKNLGFRCAEDIAP